MEIDFNLSPSNNSKERDGREDTNDDILYSNNPYKYETQKKEKSENSRKTELIYKLVEYNTLY